MPFFVFSCFCVLYECFALWVDDDFVQVLNSACSISNRSHLALFDDKTGR